MTIDFDVDGSLYPEADCHPSAVCQCPYGTAYSDGILCFLANRVNCVACDSGHHTSEEDNTLLQPGSHDTFSQRTCVQCAEGYFIADSNHNEGMCKPHTVMSSDQCTEGEHLVQGTHLKDTACEDNPIWFQGEGDDVIYVSTTTTIAPNYMGLVLLLLPLILLL